MIKIAQEDEEGRVRMIVNVNIWIRALSSVLPYLIFVIFLHSQIFWRIKFTPKNANFSR